MSSSTGPVPDFLFLGADGAEIHLHDLLGRPLLLVFLRHLA